MMDKIEPPAWIYPGARVLVVTCTPGAGANIVSRTTVLKVAGLSFTLRAGGPRISLKSLTSRGGAWDTSFQVVDPASEEGERLWAQEKVRRTRVRARNAASDWKTKDPTDLEQLDALIAALTEWREMLVASNTVPAEEVEPEIL